MWRSTTSLALGLALVACGRSADKPKEPKELETVDIGGGYDAELTTEFDEKAKRVEIDLGGVLPSDFPEGMPVFSPASVVDFGPGFVELDTPSSVTEAQSSLGGQLQRAGWSVDSIGDGGSLYSRGGRQVRITLTTAGTGARIRYEY